MKKLIWVLALAAMLLACAVGCGTNSPGTEDSGTAAKTEEQTEAPQTDILFEKGKTSPYVIIIGKNADKKEEAAASTLRNAFRQYLGLELPVRIDLILESAGYSESPYEILVGSTSRGDAMEWSEDTRVGDWYIGKRGTKLLISGFSPESTVSAVDTFVERFLASANGTVKVTDSDAVTFRATYAIPSFTVDGVEQRALTVVWSNRAKLTEFSAAILADRLSTYYGYPTELLPSTQAGTGHRLVLATVTDVPELASLLGNADAVLTAQNGNPMLLAKSLGALADAARRLAGDLETETTALQLESGKVARTYEASDTLMSMSFNLYGHTDFDTRKNAVLDVIASRLPDTFGIQEGKDEWVTLFSGTLSGIYACAGTGNQEAGATESYNNLYYRIDKYELVESGTFWLSDTPETPGSKFEESKRVRIATYALLKHRATGKQVLYVNTHLDNKSAVAREKQLVVLTRFISGYEAPCVLTGDFNSNPSTNLYRLVTSIMEDSRARAAETTNAPTYNGLGSSSSVLDYCFFSEGRFDLLRYSVHTSLYQGNIYPSDHNAVLTEYRLR